MLPVLLNDSIHRFCFLLSLRLPPASAKGIGRGTGKEEMPGTATNRPRRRQGPQRLGHIAARNVYVKQILHIFLPATARGTSFPIASNKSSSSSLLRFSYNVDLL